MYCSIELKMLLRQLLDSAQTSVTQVQLRIKARRCAAKLMVLVKLVGREF